MCRMRRAALRSLHTLASAAPVSSLRVELDAFYRSAPSHAATWLRGELASDHAGEAGACSIYEGALAGLRLRSDTGEATEFARTHLVAERAHFAVFEQLLRAEEKSRLVPAWHAAGYSLGFQSALGGSATLYQTVDAVEEFVVRHYEAQTSNPRLRAECPLLVATLESFTADEAHHRADAAKRFSGMSPAARFWATVVGRGSAAAVYVARRV